MAESEKKRVFQDRTLMCHFGGQIVAAMRFDEGVVVLAAGEREYKALFSAIRSNRCRGVVTEYPPRFKGTFVHAALHATI